MYNQSTLYFLLAAMTEIYEFSRHAKCEKCWHRHETEKKCRISRPEYPYHAYACAAYDPEHGGIPLAPAREQAARAATE